MNREGLALWGVWALCLAGAVVIAATGGVTVNTNPPTAEVTLEDVACNTNDVCTANVSVDAAADHRVIIVSPVPSDDTQNGTQAVDYYFDGNVNSWGVIVGPDVYVYEVSDRGDVTLVSAFEVTDDGAEEVEPKNPPLKTGERELVIER